MTILRERLYGPHRRSLALYLSWVDELPPVAVSAVDRALGALADYGAVLSCAHVAQTTAIWCVRHRRKLRCNRCHITHVRRSPHPCLGCGGAGVEYGALPVDLPWITTRSPDGPGSWCGELYLAGVVVCDDCRRPGVC